MKHNLTVNVFFSYCFAELSPVCAIVGGVIGQEIIKVTACMIKCFIVSPFCPVAVILFRIASTKLIFFIDYIKPWLPKLVCSD